MRFAGREAKGRIFSFCQWRHRGARQLHEAPARYASEVIGQKVGKVTRRVLFELGRLVQLTETAPILSGVGIHDS
jgi:hypothetical protein